MTEHPAAPTTANDQLLAALEWLAEAEEDLDVIVPADIAGRKGESIREFIERMRT